MVVSVDSANLAGIRSARLSHSFLSRSESTGNDWAQAIPDSMDNGAALRERGPRMVLASHGALKFLNWNSTQSFGYFSGVFTMRVTPYTLAYSDGADLVVHK